MLISNAPLTNNEGEHAAWRSGPQASPSVCNKFDKNVRNKKPNHALSIQIDSALAVTMTMRVVSLNYRNGQRVCAPIFVSLEGRNYQPTDIEFEEEALRFAMRDGLVRNRSDVVAVVGG